MMFPVFVVGWKPFFFFIFFWVRGKRLDGALRLTALILFSDHGYRDDGPGLSIGCLNSDLFAPMHPYARPMLILHGSSSI